MNLTLYPAKIEGSVRIPPSKSHTIRALLIAAFAQGKSTIYNPLKAYDTSVCLEAIQSLGAQVEEGEDYVRIEGTQGVEQKLLIDCGNSGTTLYLAAAMAASFTQKITFTGDEQLQKRPLANLLNSLRDLHVEVEGSDYPPFSVKGPLFGGETTIACPTSQYLSALLLAAPLSESAITINVSELNEKPYVDMTLAWLDSQKISYRRDLEMTQFSVAGNQPYSAFEATIGGDYSSASFFFCAAAITGSTLEIQGLDPLDVQGDKEILQILAAMGCEIRWQESTLFVTGPPQGSLQPGTFNLNAIPDTLPILAVTACFAHGVTKLIGVEQARIKETDRIAAMCSNLQAMGAKIEERKDGLVIHGRGELQGTTVEGLGDHRIVMALAIASLAAQGATTITTTEAVEVTFPEFFSQLAAIKIP